MVEESKWLNACEEVAIRLQKRAPDQWRTNRLLPETVEDLKEAGLLSLLKPRRFGGNECSAKAFFEIVMRLAEADASVAWVVAVLNSHDFHLAAFDEQAQQDVWGAGTVSPVGSPYAPVGKITEVAGGYRVSGTWKFSSGCDICEWSLLGGNLPSANAENAVAMYGKQHAAFLIPRSDYTIRENWSVHGLRATGSHDIIVDNAFVPKHRTLLFSELINNQAPGYKENTGELYKTPFFQILSRVTSAPVSAGVLKGMANDFIELSKQRKTISGVNPLKDPAVTTAIAQALMTAEDIKDTVRNDFDKIRSWSARGLTSEDTYLERLKFRYTTSAAPKRCVDAASELFRVWGGSVIDDSLPFGRHMNDLLAIRSHITNNYQLHGVTWVSYLMGERTDGWPV